MKFDNDEMVLSGAPLKGSQVRRVVDDLDASILILENAIGVLPVNARLTAIGDPR